VILTNSTVSNNKSSFGGGIVNYYGTLGLTSSTVSDNAAAGSGGGILNLGNGVVNGVALASSVFGKVTMTISTVAWNAAYGMNHIVFASLPVPSQFPGHAVAGSTFSVYSINPLGMEGWCCSGGGGIANYWGTTMLINVTISNNSSAGSPKSTLGGGGILNARGKTNLTHATFFGNGADLGGGISNYAAALTIKNSILANSASNSTLSTRATAGGNCALYTPPSPTEGYVGLDHSPLPGPAAGPAVSGGYNLSDDASCVGLLTQIGDRNGTAAGLDTGLKNNGGPTQTIALTATSPAVDAIPLIYCTDVNGNPVTSDQRGALRSQGAACDIGAFE